MENEIIGKIDLDLNEPRASSGSFQSSTIGGGFWLRCNWTVTSQSVANNTSTIRVNTTWGANSGYSTSTSAQKTGSITIDGTTQSFSGLSASLSSGQQRQVMTFTRTVSHNADGTKSLTMSSIFNIALTLSGTYYASVSASGSGTLDTIARASTGSASNWTFLNNTSVSIARASSSFTHTVQLFVNGVQVASRTGQGTSASFSFSTAENTTIANQFAQNASRTSYARITTFSGSTQIGSVFQTANVTVTNMGASTATGNAFDIGTAGTTININRANNNLTHNLQFRIGTTAIKTMSGVSGASASMTFTTGEVTNIFNQIPNSNTGNANVVVTTLYNGVQLRATTTSSNFTARVVNSNPIINGTQTYLDNNPATVAVTGDNQAVIQNRSTVSVTIPANYSVPQNGASIVSYIIAIGNRSSTVNFSASALDVNLGTLDITSSSTLSVTSVDSRGNRTSRNITVQGVSYQEPRINATAQRLNNFEFSTTITLSGSFSLLNVGGTNRNSLSQVQYRFKQTTQTAWADWINFTFSTSSSNFTASNVNTGFDNAVAFDIEIRVTDALSTSTWRHILSQGLPDFFIDFDKHSVGVGAFPTKDNVLELNGDVFTGSTHHLRTVTVPGNQGTGGQAVRVARITFNAGWQQCAFHLKVLGSEGSFQGTYHFSHRTNATVEVTAHSEFTCMSTNNANGVGAFMSHIVSQTSTQRVVDIWFKYPVTYLSGTRIIFQHMQMGASTTIDTTVQPIQPSAPTTGTIVTSSWIPVQPNVFNNDVYVTRSSGYSTLFLQSGSSETQMWADANDFGIYDKTANKSFIGFTRSNDTTSIRSNLSVTGTVSATNTWHNGTSGNAIKLRRGTLSITPVANSQTTVNVTFGETFPNTTNLSIHVSANTSVMGTTVQGVASSNATTSGTTLYLLRTNATSTNVSWSAIWRA